MGTIVIAAYKAKSGKAKVLEQLLSLHTNVLRSLGYITEHSPYIMKAKGQVYLEVFEWVAEDAISKAHKDPEVKALWDKLEEVADVISPASVEELSTPFKGFSRVE